ncbi:calcium/calmodulin-dependent protein kinase type IV [Cervus canadensis]|uniref:calcium/calmodulin-dependent protein kinase type IV n=1 Tax=Cervus canadensis TaxID=1574408 RepID=UPI001C9E7829|nr:calcium/calmodulin-dependent protein kinase type IV [Cervus canadensis]
MLRPGGSPSLPHPYPPRGLRAEEGKRRAGEAGCWRRERGAAPLPATASAPPAGGSALLHPLPVSRAPARLRALRGAQPARRGAQSARRGAQPRGGAGGGARLQGAARAGARGRGRAGAPRSGKRRRRQRSPAAKMLKVTTPSCSASSCSSVTSTVAPGPGSLVPDYWVDGSNRDALGDFFEVESELGRGATSIVYRCKQKGTQKPYALKVLKKTVDKKIVRTEIGVLLRLSHPNIIKLKEIFETPTEISLVLELVTGGELFDRIVEKGYYSERDAADAVKQILEAVAYLHENGIVHRDLKPENLLYATPAPDAPLKIADFGLSKIVEHQVLMKTVCGTPGYCAPEILRGCAYGPEVDMWSVGIITYILLCGFEPFYDERGDQFMFRRILNCEYYFISPWWDEVSLNAKDLVRKLIVLDPKKRLTTFQALQHPWVTGKAANFVHMDTAQKKLQEFNARRKLKAAVKAVVASSRLGSASSSHSSVQEGRASREPSPPQAGDEGVPGGEGPPGAAEGAGVELPEVQAGEEVSGDDGDPAPRMEPAVWEEEMEGTDPEMEGHPAGETRATAGAAAAPGGSEEDPALEVGAQQGDSVLPED